MERDLCDIVREHEENGGEIEQYEIDTCRVCGCHFLVSGVKPVYVEDSLCGYKCWTIANVREL